MRVPVLITGLVKEGKRVLLRASIRHVTSLPWGLAFSSRGDKIPNMGMISEGTRYANCFVPIRMSRDDRPCVECLFQACAECRNSASPSQRPGIRGKGTVNSQIDGAQCRLRPGANPPRLLLPHAGHTAKLPDALYTVSSGKAVSYAAPGMMLQ